MKYKAHTIIMTWNIGDGFTIYSPTGGNLGWQPSTKEAKAFIDTIA